MSMTVFAREEEVPAGVYLADCAVSGGSLRSYLRAAKEAAGENLCVVLDPVRMDFSLPCPSGVGNRLTAAELKQRRGNAPCYFSETLCTEYFTYQADGTVHAVLFDTQKSLREKLNTVEAVGISMVLIPDPGLRKTLFS